MVWVLCENLRGFTTSRPPLVLFVLCLGAFAIVLLTLAYMVKVKDLRNPDERDWNTFMEGFHQLEFCMIAEDAHHINTTTSDKPVLAQQGIAQVVDTLHAKIQGDNTAGTTMKGDNSTESTLESPKLPAVGVSLANPSRIVSVSVPVWADVKPTQDFVSHPHEVTHLSTTMSGKQIGATGSLASTEFNVTLSLPFSWNSSLCQNGVPCNTVKILTCVNIQAPARFFPQTRIPDPYGCQMANTSFNPDAENHFRMVTQSRGESGSRSPGVKVVCERQPTFTLNHKTEQGLNIMLTLQDRSAINLHLMHTSYFLFVMVVTMMCYALIRGKPGGSTKPVQYTEVSHA